MHWTNRSIISRIAMFAGVLLAVFATNAAVAIPAYTLTVSKAGSGTGGVASNSGAINCGAVCSDEYVENTVVILTAMPDAGQQFTGWLGACTGTGTCPVTVVAEAAVLATFAPQAIRAPKLDIDGTTECEVFTDGLLALRYLSGLSGSALVDSALHQDASRDDPAAVLGYLTDIRPALDIDGNGLADALTDGLLIFRYMSGVRGEGLVAGIVGPGAIRSDAGTIEPVLQNLCAVAIHVAIAGNNASPGTRAQPKRTISAGIAAAVATDTPTVVVAAGSYAETSGVTLANGVDVAGGYDAATWLPGAAETMITGPGLFPGENQYVTVLAKNLTTTTRLSKVRVVGPDSVTAGLGSHAIVAITSKLIVDQVVVEAGDGRRGSNGGNGTNASTVGATPAMKGADGGTAGAIVVVCNTSTRGQGGPAGVGANNGGTGGNGGTMDTFCDPSPFPSDDSNYTATAGINGSNGGGASMPFGQGGSGGPANSSTPGGDGFPGRVQNGAAGGGGIGTAQNANYFVSNPGGSGGLGQAGGGGGGGGGSGGNDSGIDSYGAGGGGGGAGGAAATGAAGGGGGGGISVGIYALNSTITVSNTTILRGTGGDGGNGGAGGQGQTGGAGGLAGPASDDSRAGGAGGAGAHGGHGGGGGGGVGGLSAGILHRGTTLTTQAVVYSSGVAGTGGTGGISAPGAPQQDGNNGGAGQNGTVFTALTL